jgi:hypothetical protein
MVLIVSVEGPEHVTAAIEQHWKREVLRLRDFGLFQGDSEKPRPGRNEGLLCSDNRRQRFGSRPRESGTEQEDDRIAAMESARMRRCAHRARGARMAEQCLRPQGLSRPRLPADCRDSPRPAGGAGGADRWLWVEAIA